MQDQNSFLALAAIGIVALVTAAFVIGLLLGVARPRRTPWGLDRLDTGCLVGAFLLVGGGLDALLHLQLTWAVGMLVVACLLLGTTHGRVKRF